MRALSPDLFVRLNQIKMDMPGGDIVSGLVGMFGGMFGKKSGEEGGEMSEEDAVRAIESKLPAKGIVNLRFKVFAQIHNPRRIHLWVPHPSLGASTSR